MKIEELIRKLGWFNPKRDVLMRVYTNEKKGFIDLPVSDIRITKAGGIVISNQCGVE